MINLDKATLEKACKEIIETILFCLPDAYKGTVYHIGPPPELRAVRVASGIIDEKREKIEWELEGTSDFDPPGKTWLEYRDEPNRPLEAMAWCVEKQKSWTSEDPKQDIRGRRYQKEGILEDYHHMEPVLIRKSDLVIDSNNNGFNMNFPTNYEGKKIWEDSDYVVVAVIKINFKNPIKINGPETKIIKKLSRTLGTELLSYQLKNESLQVMKRLAKEKLETCNTLAHTLRNALAKSGLIFSLIKLELSTLREQWEKKLLQDCKQKELKREAIEELNRMLEKMGGSSDKLKKSLAEVHQKFLNMSLPPDMGERWVKMQIEEKWNKLLHETSNKQDKRYEKEVKQGIEKLKRSLYIGKDPTLLSNYKKIPEDLKKEWTDLIYKNVDYPDPEFLDRISRILEDKTLNLPYQEKSRKSLIRLKALLEIMSELEHNINVILNQVLNGGIKT
ncbi:MAG: hypothetical protein DRH37_09905 [Deltaproteobacteria bacterium]|nr:MAG: hypothetical protein DRH37_09905 [Deltaproteobacteria bacterium]